jgi:hypothetical protein
MLREREAGEREAGEREAGEREAGEREAAPLCRPPSGMLYAQL